jgi:adenylate kinase family enzyme
VLSAQDPLPIRPRRILVAGVSGVGKSTLAGQIATITGSSHTEIDGLFHGPNWEPRATFVQDVETFTAVDAWTTEWQYGSARALLAGRADLLVWLDLPFAVTLSRVVRRTLRRRLRHEVLWNGNVEPALGTFFTDREHLVRWAVSTRNSYRERIPQLESDNPHLDIERLNSRRSVKRWLAGPLAIAAITD